MRTYSKRDNSNTTSTPTSTPTSSPVLSDRPAKRQRTEATPDLPALPPADSKPAKPKKHSTIDGYFSSVSTTRSSSGTLGSWLSSDTVGGNRDGAVFSPSSSPPVRRWTSPRRLKFRPSLGPIAGNVEREPAVERGKRKRSAEREDGGDAGPKRLSVGRDERVEDGTIVAEPDMSTDASSGVGGSAADARDEGWSSRDVMQRRTPSGDHSTALQKDTSAAKRKAASTTKDDDPGLPLTPKSQASIPETAAPWHDATKTSAPTYTMPYKFYLTAQQSRPSPPATVTPTAGKRPARTIQTTLNLSTKQPFKECKLCDTVFNPLHAADVRLHQARHVKMVGGKKS